MDYNMIIIAFFQFCLLAVSIYIAYYAHDNANKANQKLKDAERLNESANRKMDMVIHLAETFMQTIKQHNSN